jgi:hypothetical protein
MTLNAQQLLALLPALYRNRNNEENLAFQALLEVIAEQGAVLQQDLAQRYDDLFIETCADWAVPYLGDLLGMRGLYRAREGQTYRRAEVANTISYRRRKGTATMLEQLAHDVSGWPARVVEFFDLLATTQHLNHVRPGKGGTVDLQQWEAMEHVNTPFNSVAHVAEVRRIASSRGRYNIPNIGIFLWRLGAWPLTDSPAFSLDDHHYWFHPLGLDIPLFNKPETETTITHLAEPANVPAPISRRMLQTQLTNYYGEDRSIVVKLGGEVVPPADVAVCSLEDHNGDWAHATTNKTVAIDPVLGRLVLASPPASDVRVTFHYGFSAALGGGEYERSLPELPSPTVRVPRDVATVQAALTRLSGAGSVQIEESGRYPEALTIEAGAGRQITLCAANLSRPLLMLDDPLTIGGEQATVVLDGLLIAGNTVRVSGNVARLVLRHTTLAPRWRGREENAVSLVTESAATRVEIEHCIVGPLRIHPEAHVKIENSIVDAGREGLAYGGVAGSGPGAELRIANSTVIGRVHTRLLTMASNTLFVAPGMGGAPAVWSEQSQAGCLRFCYVPPYSRTPKRFQCQPTTPADDVKVRPQFISLRYGDPGYGQLSLRTASELRRGADDEGEIGALHHLLAPQREMNLRIRLEEYLRVGLEAGIFYVS